MNQETLTRAWEVLQDAYQAQMEGDFDRAVELYHSSLELHPTAEAHTFLGWTYHFQGKLLDAIAECRARTPEVAFAEVQKEAGHQFDPTCATAFLDIQEQIMDAMTTLRQTSVFRPGVAL